MIFITYNYSTLFLKNISGIHNRFLMNKNFLFTHVCIYVHTYMCINKKFLFIKKRLRILPPTESIRFAHSLLLLLGDRD